MNSITDLLDLEDNDVSISNSSFLSCMRLQDVLSWRKEKDYQPSNSTG